MGVMRDKDDLYQEYLACWSKGKPVTKLKFNNASESVIETLEVFKLKQGLSVKYISTKDIMSLPVDDQLIGADGFYRRQKGFYLIPNDFKGKIISFVIRGLTHDYYDVPCMSNARPLFGWSTFENFKKNTPIIVTEGTKDCIILQKYYPYVLALLTAGVTVANANILKAMTNKVILAYDRDSTGLKETKEDIKKLQKVGIQVLMIKSHKKDFGADYRESEYLSKEIQSKLNNFSKFGAIL